MSYSEESGQAVAMAKVDQPGEQFDAIIIGAGIAGLYQLYWLREPGLSVRVYESGTGGGDT